MPDHEDEEQQKEARRILRSLSESRRHLGGDDEELRRELPQPAENEPEDPAEEWMTIYARFAALVIIFAGMVYYFSTSGVSRP